MAQAELLALARVEARRCDSDAEAWWWEAASAGKTIDLPESEVAAGVRCHACGGMHSNRDCPLAP